jgi:hypothetical protein
VAVGDYLAGPNHVLPTGGSARFFSPLGVDDFLKRTNVIRFEPPKLRELGLDVMRLAAMEGLTGHGRSVDLRLPEDPARAPRARGRARGGVRAVSDAAARASSARPRRRRSASRSISTAAAATSLHGHPVLRPHARVVRQARRVRSRAGRAGDLAVDLHHTVEDVGITLGQAVREALGDASGIRRYGTQVLPMAEAKVEVAVDVSNRAYLVYRVPLDHAMIGTFDGPAHRGLPVRVRAQRRARSARRAPLRAEPAPRRGGRVQGRRARAAHCARARSARRGLCRRSKARSVRA